MKEIVIADFTPEAVVIGNGDFPVHPTPLSVLDAGAFTVCCDGAAHAFAASGREMDRIVGDGDSMTDALKERFAPIIRINPDQETNDLTKAVTYLYSKGYRKVALLGATGKREDHTLGNISLLMEYLRMGMDVRMYTDHGVFVPVSGDGRFHCPKGRQVSVFGFGTEGMTSEGLCYPLRDFTSWWQGTLNEAAADVFTIRCKGDYLVFITYESKQ